MGDTTQPDDGVDLSACDLSAACLPARREDPVVEARAAWLKAQGHDPFLEDLLPRAALRLRQGFGRLIRTATDRGVVLLLDRRMATKVYGRAFLEALPETQRCIGPWATVVQAVQAFFP